MKKVLLGLSFALMATSALGADLGIVPKAQPGQVPQTINWAGPYVGLLLGYAQKNEDTTITGNDKFSAAIINKGLFPKTIGLNPDGFTIGGRVGYDWQFGKVIVGGLADWSYSSLKANAYAGGNLIGVSYSEKINNIGDVLAKVGYLVGPDGRERVMIYALGGGTWANVKNTVSSAGILPGFGVAASGSSDSTKWGWAIGAGGEYRWDRNWSMSLEYLYRDLGTQTTIVSMPIGKNVISWNNDQKVQIQEVMLGVNYRF